MKTYSEERFHQPFDWNYALQQKVIDEESGPSPQYLVSLAESWVTCACGNQCAILPRNDVGTPEDPKLYGLGINFLEFVEEGLWSDAIEILQRIEERSAYLLFHVYDNYQPTSALPLLL